MAKIPASDLVADFQRMWKEHWNYVWGHNETGCVDCSGAFVWAWRRHGLSIYNGSNRIARVYISGSLIPYDDAKKKGLIVPGMAAFKAYSQGSSKWNLKSTYMPPKGQYYNGDTNDYYHIGLVDEDIRYVLNAQGASTGFVRSKITENWHYVAYLKDVIYVSEPNSEGVNAQMTAKIVGGSLKLRQDPSTSAKVIETMPSGATVTVIGSDINGWVSVAYGAKTGYCMSEFLRFEGEESREKTVTITIPREAATILLDSLVKVLGVG